ncbi:unnamed protein product, partial [Meganyctiphanes norvegica]
MRRDKDFSAKTVGHTNVSAACSCTYLNIVSVNNVFCTYFTDYLSFKCCKLFCRLRNYESTSLNKFNPPHNHSSTYVETTTTAPTCVLFMCAGIYGYNLATSQFTDIISKPRDQLTLKYQYDANNNCCTEISQSTFEWQALSGGKKTYLMPRKITTDGISIISWSTALTRISISVIETGSRYEIVTQMKKRTIFLFLSKLLISKKNGVFKMFRAQYLAGTDKQIVFDELLKNHGGTGSCLDYSCVKSSHLGTSQRKIHDTPLGFPILLKIQGKFPTSFWCMRMYIEYAYCISWDLVRSLHSANKITCKGNVHDDSINSFQTSNINSHQKYRRFIALIDRKKFPFIRENCKEWCLHHYHPQLLIFSLILIYFRVSCGSRPNQVLVFAQRNNLRMVPLTNTDSIDTSSRQQMDTVLPLDGVVSPLALDFLVADDLVFWTDVEAQTISRAHLNGSNQMILVRTNLEQPGGIAVDWVTQKLYWVDSGTKRIEVSNLDGSMRHLLIWEDLDKPRDIVVDPTDGLMFWSDWGNSANIESAGMDGCCRKILIEDNIKWPNGLAIDHEANTLYWLDASTNNIEMVNLDGSQRRPLIKGELSHPFGLALWNNSVYWSDWDTNSIHAADKTTGENRRTLVRSYSVFIYSSHVIQNSCCHSNPTCFNKLYIVAKGYRLFMATLPVEINIFDGQQLCINTPIALFYLKNEGI